MRHPALFLPMLIALAAPAVADAQTPSAATLAAAPQMTARATLPTAERTPPRSARRTVELRQPAHVRLIGREANEVPNVEIQAKDEWFDDEGLQWKGSKVAFKRRF